MTGPHFIDKEENSNYNLNSNIYFSKYAKS